MGGAVDEIALAVWCYAYSDGAAGEGALDIEGAELGVYLGDVQAVVLVGGAFGIIADGDHSVGHVIAHVHAVDTIEGVNVGVVEIESFDLADGVI